jgi:hypothetical protein
MMGGKRVGGEAMPDYGYAVHAAHDACARTATDGKRKRKMRIKELFTLGTSYTAWAGTGQRAFYGVCVHLNF